MSLCTLQIADRVVLQAEGPPEAEYALVDASEIELRALELGAIREVGYATTVGDARSRLRASGISSEVVDRAQRAARRTCTGFARGEPARRIVKHLNASELFDGAFYRSDTRTYEGFVLDMPALSAAVGTMTAAATLQAIALAGALDEAQENAPVVLTTLPYMVGRRPGERSFRRIAFRDVARVLEALESVHEAGPTRAGPPEDSIIRTNEDLLARLRDRGLTGERLVSIEQALTMVTPPTTGPLADPSAWAIELQLQAGELLGALDRIDALERKQGPKPVTVYLRSRASLLLGAETPRTIAERVASLCATHPYAEFSLLAAQAWLSAGELNQALPFARAVVLNSEASVAIRDRAEDILGGPTTSRTGPPAGLNVRSLIDDDYAAGEADPSMPANAAEPKHPSISSALDIGWDQLQETPRPASFGPKALLVGTPGSLPATSTVTSTTAPSKPPTAPSIPPAPPTGATTSVMPSVVPPRAVPRAAATSRPPPPRPRKQSVAPPVIDVPGELVPQSDKHRAATKLRATTQVGFTAPPPSSEPAPPLVAVPVVSVDAIHPVAPFVIGVADATLETPSIPPDLPASPQPAAPWQGGFVPHVGSAPPPSGSGQNSFSPSAPFVPPSIPPNASRSGHGASLPAFVSDVPPPVVPAAPRLPRFEPGPPEVAETLSLPPGLHGQIAAPNGDLPRGVMEARIFFTHQSRELGRDYRMQHGIMLRTDVQAIEHMQTVLRERLPDGAIKSREDAMLVRRHGAFLTEILARTLGAIWVDVAPTEIGYWAMLVPPSTRVWPFGRVLRLLLRGYRERDLVSYYLELKSRSRRGT